MGLVTEEYSFLYKELVTAKEKWKELYRPLQPTLESFHKSKMNFKVLLRTIITFYFIIIFFPETLCGHKCLNIRPLLTKGQRERRF